MNIYNFNYDFNLYKAFYAVAEYESFSKAAEALYISQPAISYSIKKLEKELETKLFIRLNKNIKLTEDGEKLKFYIDKAFNNMITGYKVLKESDKELTGEISIGLHSNVGAFLLPNIIKKFTKLHPNVNINVFCSTTDEMKEKFKNRTLDILILHYPIFSNSDTYTEKKLFSSESCFFSNKAFYEYYMSAKKEKSLSEFPMMMPLKGFTTSNLLDNEFKKNNIAINPKITVYTDEVMVKFVEEGLGIGWTIKKTIKERLGKGDFFEIPVDFKMPVVEFSIAYNEKFINNTALEFANFIIKEVVDH